MRDLPEPADKLIDDLIDDLVDDLLEGRTTADDSAGVLLAAFVHELRAEVQEAPEPVVGARLAAVLAHGLTTDKGDLPATAGSNANGSAPVAQEAGLPKWRAIIERSNDRMEQTGRSIRAKVAAGLAAAFVGTLGVGAAGALPGPAQTAADKAFETVGLERPGQADEHTDDLDVPDGDVEVQTEKPDGAGVDGSEISDRATSGEPTEDGQEFGESVADEASEHGRTTADEAGDGESDAGQGDAGTSDLPDEAPIGSAPPEETPPAGPETGDDASSQSSEHTESTPDEDENPGSDHRPGEGD